MLDLSSQASAPRQMAFDHMRQAFLHSGGLLDADELAHKQAQRLSNGLGAVARWIVLRRIVSIPWGGGYWIPCFQFAQPSFVLRASLAGVLDELNPVMDDWELAGWFAMANDLLDGACPACALGHSPLDVRDAARAHRFAVCG
ncbi:hypothetical protein [uncultured Ramlibacter sp.]|uniref:hypothetical protein n=1 Tax=uncultured Ramlibacter sp. TaxID=260755 RepID=UPI00262C5A34|nr:hypothetical protein [uncultured Ramlibacter sp.]